MLNFRIKFEELDNLRQQLNTDRITNQLGFAIGFAIKEFETGLETAIAERYNLPRSVVSTRLKQKLTTERLGKFVIRSGLEYKSDTFADLAVFPYAWYWGNINPNASRPGRVHAVQVKKDNTKIVYGRKGFGGFTQRNPAFGGRIQMFERDTRSSKAPLHILWGPTTVDMINWTYEYNPKIQEMKNNIDKTILSNLNL